MKPVVPHQLVGPDRAIRRLFTPIGIEKDRSRHVGTVAISTHAKLADSRFHDRQWVTTAALANVKMNRKAGFLRKEGDERRVPEFAFAFTAHEDASPLRAMAIGPWHQPIRGTAPKTPPRYFR